MTEIKLPTTKDKILALNNQILQWCKLDCENPIFEPTALLKRFKPRNIFPQSSTSFRFFTVSYAE